MNLTRWSITTFTALTVFSAPALATKILIVTDQAKAVKAQEVAKLFKTTEPFSLMRDLSFEVIQTTSRKLGCETKAAALQELSQLSDDDALARSESQDRLADIHEAALLDNTKGRGLPPSCSGKDGSVPTRLVSCGSTTTKTYISGLLRSEKATYAIIVKDESRYGGSGGATPVITTGSPASMAIHELMHRLGFADEYGYYNSCEADIYCDVQSSDVISKSGYGALPGTSFNVALFNSRASYKTDAEVRTRHGSQIPWLSSIAKATKLTNSTKLGTPEANKVGIFRAIVCDKATKTMETWQATAPPNIMRTLSTTLIPKPYWPTLAKSLGTKISARLTSSPEDEESGK